MSEVKKDNLPVAKILIDNLYKSYGPKEVLKGLNLEVYEGEMFGFIGRNGIGKSTTIDCMIGRRWVGRPVRRRGRAYPAPSEPNGSEARQSL